MKKTILDVFNGVVHIDLAVSGGVPFEMADVLRQVGATVEVMNSEFCLGSLKATDAEETAKKLVADGWMWRV